MEQTNSYVIVLVDTLQKKSHILDGLLSATKDQEELIAKETFQTEPFEQAMERKEWLLKELTELDQGFAAIYDRVKEELSSQKQHYKEDIQTMQRLIQTITSKGMELQALELRNKANLEISMVRNKGRVRQVKAGSQAAANYYQSMKQQQSETSLFVDKKK